MAASGQCIETLVQKLDSSDVSTVKTSLATITKLSKRAHFVGNLKKNGGIKKIIALLTMTNSSVVDMSMSAIANCSMFEEGRKEVRHLDGITVIVAVLKNLNTTSILNRTARALANLAEDALNAEVIEELGAIQELSKLMMNTTDTDCQESVLRALRIICTTSERKKIAFELGGFKTMIEFLKSEKAALQNCCIRTMCEFTKNCTKEFAQQVQEFDGIKHIVSLANSSRPAVCHAAILTITNLAVHSHVRVCIGSEGGIQHLCQQAKKKETPHLTIKALEGLCYCCREAVNRNKVFESGGLEVLMQELQTSEHPFLHRKIIAAFNCFYYNEQCLEFLLGAGIIPALVSHLRKIITHCANTIHHTDDMEHENYDNRDFSSDFSSLTSTKNTLEFGTPGSISMNEAFLEEAESLAIQVRDSTESSRMLGFKRKPRSRSASETSPQVLKSIDQSPAVFSFCSMDSCTMTSSARSGLPTLTSVTTRPTALISKPPGLICSSTPMKAVVPPECQNTDFQMPEEAPIKFQSIPSSDLSPIKVFDEKELGCFTESATGISKPVELDCHRELLSERKQKILSTTCLKDCIRHEEESGGEKDKLTSPVEMSPKSTTFSQNRTTATQQTPDKTEDQSTSHHIHSPGHSTILLLSRFSQMNDQKTVFALLTKPCMDVLLDYMSLIRKPSPKCARLLLRLTREPDCFEMFVTLSLASNIYRKLVHGSTVQYCTAENEKSQEEALSLSESRSDKDGAQDGEGNRSVAKISSHSNSKCRIIGEQLLNNLSCQAQSPYGRGVLMHLLAKESGDDWQSCVVSLPHLCRSRTLQQQLLLHRGGLKFLVNLLKDPPNDRTFADVVHGLVLLSSETGMTLKKGQSELTSDILSGEKRKRDSEDGYSSGEEIQPPGKLRKIDESRSVRVSSLYTSTCKYRNHSHLLFDVHFEVDSGERISAHKQILCKASEMFTAMLSSSYKESSQDVIPLKDVTMATLTCVIHHSYGCIFPYQDDNLDSKECNHIRELLDSAEEEESKLSFLLELLTIADRYLISRLKNYCQLAIQPLVTPSNVVSTCIQGMHYQSSALVDYTLQFLLLQVPHLPCQYQLFKELLCSPDKYKILEHLYRLLLRQLELRRCS